MSNMREYSVSSTLEGIQDKLYDAFVSMKEKERGIFENDGRERCKQKTRVSRWPIVQKTDYVMA